MDKLLILIAILPVILIGIYIYKKDKHKEPISLLVKFFLLGILSSIITIIISKTINHFIPILSIDTNNMNPIELFVHVFIFIALIEELCKWVFVYFVGYNNKEFDEIYDMIVYAVFVSLGFATIENIYFIIGNGTISTGVYRGLLAIPGHTCFAIFMGYYLSMAKYYKIRNNKLYSNINKIKSIIIPIILHCIYDYCCMASSEIFVVMFFVFVINLYVFAHQKLKYASNEMSKLKE